MIYMRSYVIMLSGRLPETENKRMCTFWPKKWSWSLKKFEWWSLTRQLLKQYLTAKRNRCLQGGRLRKVVAYEKWSL